MSSEADWTRFRAALGDARRSSEPQLLPALIAATTLAEPARSASRARALELARALRSGGNTSWIAQLLREYPLGTRPGLALMSLAEAFLRVPDARTRALLLRDKLCGVDWVGADAPQRSPPAMRAARHALAVVAWLLAPGAGGPRRWLAPLSERTIGLGTRVAMGRIAGEFVFARDIDTALTRARGEQLICSFDMLGEAARTHEDAERYFDSYAHAIAAAGRQASAAGLDPRAHTISIKLSALHPRYETAQEKHVVPELAERLLTLARQAAGANIGITVDAEECDRLELSLQIVEAVAGHAQLRGWDGLGLAVQAYQKRAPAVIGWLDALAGRTRRHLQVRLVKGAYWDMEIKRAQERGLETFPVFTRKAATDVGYLACARALLAAEHISPAFATHNALTIATLLEWIGTRRDVEFQRLHGMGAELYAAVARMSPLQCRIYAPVGAHRDLLPYLIRRMLENGANSGFVQQSSNPDISDEQLIEDPASVLMREQCRTHPGIALPAELYAPQRRNSGGLDLNERLTLDQLNESLWSNPAVTAPSTASNAVRNPASTQQIVGYVRDAQPADVTQAIDRADAAREHWQGGGVGMRAACLERTADLLEAQLQPLMRLLMCEAGKTRADALSEVREATDFCRYYAAQARTLLAGEQVLPGPVGELNVLNLRPRGVFACISPWNFPLAIFLGQIAAALVTGNTVVAKAAPQTPLVAQAAVELLRQAGVPPDAIQLLTGGAEVGQKLIEDPRIAGAAFTGSTRTARRIAQTMIADERRGLPALIAETGGINAMIVDSTALIEQVVADVITSAFQSAGQRCSALRLLCLQDEIYDPAIVMLKGAMAQLRVGNPLEEDTDVGPLIDAAAQQRIRDYLARQSARTLYATPLAGALDGWFVAPTLIELARPEDLREEIFGPVLHVTRWRAGQLRELVESINASGYGLTLGLHSRLASAAALVREHARVGNLYVNRSMIGAVVGSQPFGGEGLSGTGPKAGGPHYLQRFCTERTCSTDTTSAGGNASLMALAG